MTDNVITIRDKINQKMEKLEQYVATNAHITHPHIVREHLKEIHKYYTLLEREDQQYVGVIEDFIGRDDTRWF